ncbi:MAG TPA: BatA domain-containing protein [Vicinamibacterales bacterium]|nr:BatA domain-containing protein [Vicinamibacterales bacterium]
MTFLAPLFALALAGLAIPILLHLTQKEKKEVVFFPSLMFVRKIPYQASRRRRIQHWLLLMLRMAALALIVLAFTRPLWNTADAPIALGQGAREVVVLLDTSYSMGYGPRWAAAMDAARTVVSGLGASDRASIVTFGSGTEILLRNTAEHSALNAAVASAKPAASATRYAPALKVAGSLLAESQLPRREVVLISDFQRAGWRGQEGTSLPAGAALTTVPIQGTSDRPNLSVTAVSLQRSRFANQERVTVTAGITNRSETAVTNQPVTLEAGGLQVAAKTFNVEGGASTSVSFDAVTIAGRNYKGTVRLGEDALVADNAFHFVVSPSEPVHVILVDRGGGSSLYVGQALTIGDAPKFDMVTRQPENLSDDDLRRTSLVVLNDVPVTSPLARRLHRFVEQGGGLLMAAGGRAAWPRDVDLLPATIGNPVDRTRGDTARVGGIEFGHPVFETFRAPRSGDFTSVRVYGYRNLSPATGAQVLARFDAGPPAVVERRVGAGRVLLWASSFDQSWTDLPLKSVFLPFVQRAATHLVAYVPSQPWSTVGQILDTSRAGAHKGQSVPTLVLTPSGNRLPVSGDGTEVIELTEQGFYELRGDSKSTGDMAVVASNVDPAEADLTAMDPQDIVAASTGESQSDGVQPNAAPQTPETRERGQRLWWYLLLLGAGLLAAETVVSNRLKV